MGNKRDKEMKKLNPCVLNVYL